MYEDDLIAIGDPANADSIITRIETYLRQPTRRNVPLPANADSIITRIETAFQEDQRRIYRIC